MWIGVQALPFTIQPAAKSSVDKYNDKIDNYAEMKVHEPLEIKDKSTEILLFVSKEKSHLIFINKSKEVNNPHNIYDVITGQFKAANLDLMIGAVKTENLKEPKEAIAVLLDISSSMSEQFFKRQNLNRMGAVIAFFKAFADRTIAYSFEHVV